MRGRQARGARREVLVLIIRVDREAGCGSYE